MKRRHCAAAALIAVCALAMVSLPVQAWASPAPIPSAAAAPSARAGKSLAEVREEIDQLYREAGAATDAYNLAEEKVEKQTAELDELGRAIDEGRQKIARLKDQAGAQAREQYRNAGLPPGTQLALSSDPRLFLYGLNQMRQSQQASDAVLADMTRAQADLELYTEDAQVNWEKLEAGRLEQARAKKEINARIDEAKAIEAQLEEEERARLLELEKQAQAAAQSSWLSSGALHDINRAASPSGRTAVRFALAQIGKPYVWGAEGPGSYDCSGLTSQAWAAAKRPIPRTSQEQWARLPHIAVGDMRPGDLIIYHSDATHVGMYVGDGMVVHAPRPGRNVTLAGAGSMEILGVVRPDA
ncbi:NlpC/P60 family protein [Streptomyces sp. NBC_00101]|uniref:C40 family peptidase n=1 Tax=Streptomyces sp. NBC_00101 TaxID=2975651 RepID=UPI0032508248